VLLLPSGWLRESFSTLFLLLVPGYFLYRMIGRRSSVSFPHALAYSVGLSLALLMVIGLAVNWLFALSGVAKPLAVVPLVTAVGAITLAIIACSSVTARHSMIGIKQVWQSFWQADWRLLGAGALLPFLAVGGANMLNNGGPNWLAVLALLGV